jgi:photosystem II stability/assembly factor-like uncharacterized protein
MAAAVLAAGAAAAEPVAVGELAARTHFHGLAVDRADSGRLYLATHHGLFVVGPDGMAELVSDVQDFMGFSPHPEDSGRLYASGHPAGGGNLGVVRSEDGGRSWRMLSPGVGGPVDFHQMDVSPADPETLYGAFAGRLQVSRDGGAMWRTVGPAPEGLIDLAASAEGPDVLIAATRGGLLESRDGGRSWAEAHPFRGPATMVQTGPAGEVYAFLVGGGLVRRDAGGTGWRTLSRALDPRIVLHLAADPDDPARLYVVAHDPPTERQSLLASADGGATWSPLGAAAAQRR